MYTCVSAITDCKHQPHPYTLVGGCFTRWSFYMSSTCRLIVCNAKWILLQKVAKRVMTSSMPIFISGCRYISASPVNLSSVIVLLRQLFNNFIALKDLSTVQVETGIVQKIPKGDFVISKSHWYNIQNFQSADGLSPSVIFYTWPSTEKKLFFTSSADANCDWYWL